MIRFVVTSGEKSEFETAALNARQSLSEWLRGAARMRALHEETKSPRLAVEGN